jgi:hypothetical protein
MRIDETILPPDKIQFALSNGRAMSLVRPLCRGFVTFAQQSKAVYYLVNGAI